MSWVAHASPEQERRSRYPLIISTCVIFTLIAILIVGLRLRLYISKHGWRFTYAELFVIVSVICSIGFNAFTIIQTKYGLGLLPKDRPKEDLHLFIIYNYVPRPFYLFGIGAFKVALCLVARQIATGASFEKFRSIMLVVAWFAGISQSIFTLMNMFSCVPLKKIFTPSVPGECLPYGPTNWVIAAVSIATDCFVFFSPLYPIFKTQLRSRKKWQLGVSFALGLLTTLFSALRMSQIPQIAYGNGDSTMLVLWSAIEMNVGIITTSLPFLGQLTQACLYVTGRSELSGSYTGDNGKSLDNMPRSMRHSRRSRRESIDSGSDVIILRDRPDLAVQSRDVSIRKTTDVTVSTFQGERSSSRNENW